MNITKGGKIPCVSYFPLGRDKISDTQSKGGIDFAHL